MIKLPEGELKDYLPSTMKNDIDMICFSHALKMATGRLLHDQKSTMVHNFVENLNGQVLDVLAVELRCPYYSDSMDIVSKRRIIKSILTWYIKAGTTKAVEELVSAIFGFGETEEWFEYNGLPYHFRMVVDTSGLTTPMEHNEIINIINKCKRLSAHLDGVYYQYTIRIVIMPQTEYFLYDIPMTGQLKAGTYPNRNTEGVISNPVIYIKTKGTGYLEQFVPAGTKPYRNITFAIKDSNVVTDSDTKNYIYFMKWTGKPKVGTIPYRQTAGNVDTAIVVTETRTTAVQYEFDFIGTKPYKNITAEFREAAAVGKTKADYYVFENDIAGTKPKRAVTHAVAQIQTIADTEFLQYSYRIGTTGKEKAGMQAYINTKPRVLDKGMSAVTETENYQYEVKYCGKNRL